MEPVAVSSSRPAMARVVTHDGMLSVRIIRICFKKLWGIGKGGQRTNRFSRGNRNGSWKRIRGIPGFFRFGGDYHQWEWEGDSNMGYHNQLRRDY